MTISEANTPLSKGIQEIITQKGLKNLYVAQKAGFTSQEFSDMLNGRRLIKACDIPKLALALGVEINEIYATGKKGE
ncbi:MAG: helix-turn-helix transcriptional regulator [Bacillota bacterium]|nr:helix-turn-helix transcriptional regulator [Bacillota bacterium]